MKAIPCLCCGNDLDVKPDKRGHPFLNCHECGVNIFVHRPSAVDAFKTKYDWTPKRTGTVEPPPEPPAPPTEKLSSFAARKRARGGQ